MGSFRSPTRDTAKHRNNLDETNQNLQDGGRVGCLRNFDYHPLPAHRRLHCGWMWNGPLHQHLSDDPWGYSWHIHAFYLLYVYYDRKEQAIEGRYAARKAPGIYSSNVQTGGLGYVPGIVNGRRH